MVDWIDEQIKNRKENNKKALENSFNHLAGLRNDNANASREDFIVHQLARYFHIDNLAIPERINKFSDKVSYLVSNCNLVFKKVELTKNWNVDCRDPLIVIDKEDSTQYVLLPKGSRSYYYIAYETGKKVRVTSSFTKKLQVEAYAFYKPLPTHKLTTKEYFAFYRKSARWTDILLVTLLSAAVVAVGMVIPYLTKILTGKVVQEKNMSLFASISIYIVAVGLGFVLIKAAQAYMNSRITIKVEKKMRETTMMRLLSLSPSFYKKHNTGELVTRFNSVSTLSSLMLNGVFLTSLSFVMSFAYIFQISQFVPSLVLPVIIILIVTTLFSISISLLQVKVSRKQIQLSAKESGTSYAIISGIQKIRLAGAEERAFAKWVKDYARYSDVLYRPPLLIRLSPAISSSITLLGQILIYFIAAKNNVQASSFVAFTASYATLSAAVATLSEIVYSFAKIKPVLDMIKPILEAEIEDDETKKVVKQLDGNIRLENIRFRYAEGDQDILKNISVDIKEGEYVGVVGQTGCGKSTLVRLLLGFEKPTEGHIYFDNQDIDTLNLQSLRSKIGTVTQNGGVFHADIMSNILITAQNLGEKEAWEAAEIAGIAKDIKAMPMGMRTVISEGQGGISGGQKQRIMIARAIVNKPKVLIFDEATSALDNITQKSISNSISELKCTRIVIAHRLSTIKDCDRILYMESGNIVESGTYQELIDKDGKFAELVRRQRL